MDSSRTPRTFTVSNDPRFTEKLEDVVGLYLNAPEHSLVLCCDEKSQLQALDPTQPGLPLKKGRAGTVTHDYLHAHWGLLVQHGAAFLSRSKRQSPSAGGVSQPAGPHHLVGEIPLPPNQTPEPFVWTAKATDIPAKVTRARRELNRQKRNAN